MLRTKVVRRAARLLGAVTVTGVLSVGALSASAGGAHACSGPDWSSSQGNGLLSQASSKVRHSQFGNGI